MTNNQFLYSMEDNMCKYCQKENRLKMSTLYSVSQNTELE